MGSLEQFPSQVRLSAFTATPFHSFQQFVHVPKERRQGKLNKKAVKMIFIGYEQGSKGYKFWDASSRQIVVPRDVTFDEDSFPARIWLTQRLWDHHCSIL